MNIKASSPFLTRLRNRTSLFIAVAVALALLAMMGGTAVKAGYLPASHPGLTSDGANRPDVAGSPLAGAPNLACEASLYLRSHNNDMGAAINACIASLPLNEQGQHAGLVTIAPGTYNATTTVRRPQPVTIRGSGSGTTVKWTAANGLFAVDGDTTNPSVSWATGGWEYLRVIGPGASRNSGGFYIGGDPAKVISNAGTFGPGTLYQSVEITGFRTGLRFGSHSWAFTCSSCKIHGNYTGVEVDSRATDTGEEIVFKSSGIFNNSHYALYAPGALVPYFTWKLDSSLVDYNGSDGSVAPIVGMTVAVNSHFEQRKGPFFDMTAGGGFIDTGSYFLLTSGSGTDACFGILTANTPSSFVNSYFQTWHPVKNLMCGSDHYRAFGVHTSGAPTPNAPSGYTGTKKTGSCVLTIQDGIITNVTGC